MRKIKKRRESKEDMSCHYLSPNDELHPPSTIATSAIQKFGAKATPNNPNNNNNNNNNNNK